MSNGTVTKEDFQKIQSVEVKLNILFETIQSNHDEQLKKCLCRADKCTALHDGFLERIKGLERRKKFDTAVGAVSGFIGGVITVIAKAILMK